MPTSDPLRTVRAFAKLPRRTTSAACQSAVEWSSANGKEQPELREELLSEERREQWPLKNGADIEIGIGQAYLRTLEGMLTNQPELFDSCRMIAQGQGENVPEAHRRSLRKSLVLRPDGTLLPGFADILLSAYQETPEGPVLANPFRLDSQEQADRMSRLETKSFGWLLRRLQDHSPQSGRQP